MDDDIIDIIAPEAPKLQLPHSIPHSPRVLTSYYSNHSFTHSNSPALAFPTHHVDHHALSVCAAARAMETAL
jgi:hypothetical protein